MKTAVMISAVVMAVIMAVLLGLILYRVKKDTSIISQLRKQINGHDYGRLTALLVKSGMADKITPPVYRLVQGILFFIGFAAAAGASGNWIACLLCGGLSVAVPDIFIRLHTKRENQRMLPDIEHLYHLLQLQHQAGAFIMDSLIDSYRVVTYWRLKKALVDLTGAISNKKPVREAAEEFASKFDNPYLTTLADIIRHSVEDGNTDTMLTDMSEQLADIQQAQYVTSKGRQELAGVIICTLLFAGIIAGILIIGFDGIVSGNNLVFW